MLALFLSLALAPPPTPGPLEQAGAAADQALRRVARSLQEALLESKVKVALLEHLKAEALQVEVEASGRRVILTGKVRQRSSVMVAEEVARSVAGVGEVKNLLHWESSSEDRSVVNELEQRVLDQLLEARVKGRLLENLGRVAFSIEVEASSGVVALSGTVPRPEQRKLAREVAEATPGVRQVHDLLRVQP